MEFPWAACQGQRQSKPVQNEQYGWDGPSACNSSRYVFTVAAALLLVFASTSGPALGRGAHKTSALAVIASPSTVDATWAPTDYQSLRLAPRTSHLFGAGVRTASMSSAQTVPSRGTGAGASRRSGLGA